MKSLNNINPGENARIGQILMGGSMRRRLLDIGLTPDTYV